MQQEGTTMTDDTNRSADALERIDEIVGAEEDHLTATVAGVEVEIVEAPEGVLPALIEHHEAAVENVNLPAATKELIVQINPDATAAELEVFFYQCARTGLDPIANQIYLVRRSNRMVIQTGIDGYRLVASRSGLMAGSDDPEFTEKDGLPESATVTVYRIAADGERYGYTATARWSEYAPNVDASEGFMWKKMPHTMLGKCAEACALRKAFPNELSGLYTDVEMAQAGAADSGPRIEAKVSDRHFCPACAAAGTQTAVIDNREKHLNPDEGKNAQPPWKCSLRSKCAEGSKWGWSDWEIDYFDDLETSDPEQLQTELPSMSGIFKIVDTPKDAVRKWLNVAFQRDADEAGLFWKAVLERDPKIAGIMDLLTEEQALGVEGGRKVHRRKDHNDQRRGHRWIVRRHGF